MDERNNRTWLCSVVFTDIVRYSQQPIERQLDLKSQLEGYIAHALARVAPDNRIIVDTGDGAALCFLGDPEEALVSSIGLRDVLRDAAGGTGAGLQVRIGVNLGPIKVVKSLNGQLNPLGDGINKAQRVMSFAEPNQVLVSRSFYDVIACLSNDYAQLFQYRGIQKDKHGVEHPLYEVMVPGQPDTQTRLLLTRVVEQETSVEVALAKGWDPAVLDAVSAELASFIGPIAKVLVKKSAKLAADPDELRQLLAETIPLDENRRAFMHRMGPRAEAPVPEPAAGRTEAQAPSAPADAPGPTADPDALAEVEQHLAAALGPVARVLVKRHAKAGNELPKLCRLLAEEISSPVQRSAFLAAVARFL